MLIRLLERIHGHLGWLAVATAIHPAIVLRNPRRRARLAAALAAIVTTLTGLLGMFIYPDYSRTLKRPMFLASPFQGELFERKEHLAFAALALVWTGCCLHFLSRGEDEAAVRRARAAHLAFVAAAIMAFVVAVLGTEVASFLSF
jgi:hypothetical protein